MKKYSVTFLFYFYILTTSSQNLTLKILHDPEVRISYDGNVPHMEAYITASATNPDFLVACGELLVPGRGLGSAEARLYYSSNAGATWETVLLPNEINGTWDNALSASADGSVYFLTSNSENGLTLYYTNDLGKSWNSSLVPDTRWDRPYITIDNTNSPYRGRLYIVGESNKGASIISSTDGGRTFSKPVVACPKKENWNAAATGSPIVLGDGTLLVPCGPYPNFPERATWSEADIGLVASNDGGLTFEPFQKIFTVHRQLAEAYYSARASGKLLLSGNFMIGPSFATSKNGQIIYAAWQDVDSKGNSRLLFSFSSDRGEVWSQPIPVNPSSTSSQAAPMIAVNQNGVVGIAWLDDRNSEDKKGYDLYFAATSENHISFSMPVRISTVTSRPSGMGSNTLPSFRVAKAGKTGQRSISMNSSSSTRATGADYSSMAIDAAGRFHPLWLDARMGNSWQLYTSTIRVEDKSWANWISARQQQTNLHECVLDDRIQLVIGETQWNNAEKEVSVPIRIVNNSKDTISRPIQVLLSELSLSSTRAKTYANVKVPYFYNPESKVYEESLNIEFPIRAEHPLFPNSTTREIILTILIDKSEWMEYRMKVTLTSKNCLQSK